ncbi:hypothetical protein [uncultured Sphingomonas sp.]|uniref:hypothetical protein n=1 Tax=uncultured Sphingomonas sp. TaxID=158754 RepID=UPI0035CB6DC6
MIHGRRLSFWTLPVILALSGGGAAAAQTGQVPVVPVLHRPATLDQTLAAGQYDDIHSLVRARHADGTATWHDDVFDGVAWLRQDRDAEAEAAFRRAETAADAPTKARVVFLELLASLTGGAGPVSERVLNHVIERQPGAIAELPPRLVAAALAPAVKEPDKARLDAMIVPLVRLGLGRDDPPSREELVMLAVDARLRAGASADAAALLAEVYDRDRLEAVLTDRRFTALWPALERRVGPHMDLTDTAAIEIATRREAVAPDDGRLRRALIHADRVAGRLAEGDRAGADYAVTVSALASLDEEGSWAVEEHALVLEALGRIQAADARLAGLEVADVTTHPWLVGQAINRADRQVTHGRWDAAEATLARTELVAGSYGSPYAAQVVRELKLCVARGRNPQADVSVLLEPLRAHRADNPSALAAALVCAGDEDGAAAVLIAMFADPASRAAAIAAVQPPYRPTTDPSALQLRAEALARRPDVLAALEPVGRILPADLRPAVGR